MVVNYCIASWLNSAAFTANTDPTTTEVEEFINMNEDYIDDETMHAWRSRTVTKAYSHLKAPPYAFREGSVITLNHRSITTFVSGTDLLEVWDGSQWIDYVATKTEDRAKDFWVNYRDGFIFIKTFPSTVLPRAHGVRVTYRYGETTVNGQIKKACILLTAADIVENDDKSILLPEGTSNVPLLEKAKIWREKAEDIIARKKETKVLAY